VDYGENQHVAETLVKVLSENPERLCKDGGALTHPPHGTLCIMAGSKEEKDAESYNPAETFGELAAHIENMTPVGLWWVKATAWTLGLKKRYIQKKAGRLLATS
jgi:hypothetical protein